MNFQKNLEVIHKRFSSILNSSADAAIIATDPQGIVRQFNKGASVMLGYGHGKIIGKSSLLNFFSDLFIKELKAFIFSKSGEQIKVGDLFSYCSDHPDLVNQKEWFFSDKHGKSIDIKISISTVQMEDDEFAGILIIAQDISELNRVKEELEDAKLQAEEISRMKTSFLANMSHEIRTPLNGIIGMTDLLKGTELSSVQKNYSSIILKSANSLLLLINDILDYSKIEAGKLKLGIVSFNLRSLMEDIKDMLLINVKERNIDFDIRIDPSVSEKLIGDPRRIKQILLNLIGNALKFTLKGFIEIEIYQISEIDRDVTLYFKVIDSGIGISQDEKVKLFKTFSQVDTSTTRKYGGTGLGLAISKELVSMMDGEIGVVSRKSEGSTFWFTIKVEKEAEKFKKKSILLVNSNKLSRKVLIKNLKNLDIQLKTVNNGDAGLQKLQSSKKNGQFFDLIIINDILSDTPEDELAMRIRQNPDFQYIKMILTSYSTDVINDVIADKSVFDGFITLPTTQKQIEEILIDLFKNSTSLMNDEGVQIEIEPGSEEETEETIKVLVAEDNKINQLVAMNFLKKLGYVADLVENGQEAVKAYSEKYYDLILMDQMMPVMDGIEATREIRKGGSEVSNKDILIIALTANAMKGDREILIESGMDDYISKPVLLKDIKSVLEKNLKMKGRIQI